MLGSDWVKSKRSFSNSNCLEARWRKPSRSQSNGHCFEGRQAGGAVQVRDSKDPGPVLSLTPGQWRAFLATVKAA